MCVRVWTQVRRSASGLSPPPPQQLSAADQAALQGDCCALCTEAFTEHPEWPLCRTECGHAFHQTCLGQLLQLDVGRRKCAAQSQGITQCIT